MRTLLLILFFAFFKGNAQDEKLYDFNWKIIDTVSYKTTVKTKFINSTEKIESISESEYLTKLTPHESIYIDLIIEKLEESESSLKENKIVGRINLKGELLLINDKGFVEFSPSILELPKNKIGLNQKWNLNKNIEKVSFLPDSMNIKNEVIFKDITIENNQRIALFEYNYSEFYEFEFDQIAKTSSKFSLNGLSYFSLDLGVFLRQKFTIEISSFSKDFIEDEESRIIKTIELNTTINK